MCVCIIVYYMLSCLIFYFVLSIVYMYIIVFASLPVTSFPSDELNTWKVNSGMGRGHRSPAPAMGFAWGCLKMQCGSDTQKKRAFVNRKNEN